MSYLLYETVKAVSGEQEVWPLSSVALYVVGVQSSFLEWMDGWTNGQMDGQMNSPYALNKTDHLLTAYAHVDVTHSDLPLYITS